MKKYIICALLIASSQLWAQTVKMESIPKPQTTDNDPAKQNKEPEISISTPENAPDSMGENAIYSTVGLHVQPEFPGGIPTFFEFINDNIVKPHYEGEQRKLRVIVSFIIEKDGSISGIDVARDPGFDVAEAVVETINKSPKWMPGIYKGKVVRVKYSLPIIVNLP